MNPILFLVNITQGPWKTAMGETKFTKGKKNFRKEKKIAYLEYLKGKPWKQPKENMNSLRQSG